MADMTIEFPDGSKIDGPFFVRNMIYKCPECGDILEISFYSTPSVPYAQVIQNRINDHVHESHEKRFAAERIHKELEERGLLLLDPIWGRNLKTKMETGGTKAVREYLRGRGYVEVHPSGRDGKTEYWLRSPFTNIAAMEMIKLARAEALLTPPPKRNTRVGSGYDIKQTPMNNLFKVMCMAEWELRAHVGVMRMKGVV